jgi:hypothetical protein
MPKVVYSPNKGIVEKPGTGFEIEGVALKEPQHTVTTFKGAQYSFTAVAETGDNYDGKYFTMYGQGGTKYGVWTSADGGSEPTDATVDTWIAVSFAALANAATAAAAFVTAIDAHSSGTVFESVAATAVVTIYVLQTGELTTTGGENVDSPVTGFTETNGAGSLNSVGNSQIALATAGDVATVVAQIPLADGTVVGQRVLVHVSSAASNGAISLTGNFSGTGTHTNTILTFGGADAEEYFKGVWTGVDWALVAQDGTTQS